MIVASDDAAFGLPEVTRGLVAAAGGVYRLPRVLPRPLAMELIATGSRLEAHRAVALGMVNYVVPKAETLTRALDLATAVTANAPIAVRESLAISRVALDYDDPALMRLSADTQARIMQTDDFQEGPRAFVEKRLPRWVGH
jgi:enoyl-CoA hydratase/carnithine racemase